MLKRASKRLVCSIIALVASVLLCIGVCLAWFAANSDVSGNGMQTQVDSTDIVSFGVTAYYLDYHNTSTLTNEKFVKTTNGNLSDFFNKVVELETVDGELSVRAAGSDQMRPYDSLRPYATAILFEIKYQIKEGSDKNFRIYADCPTELVGMPNDENVFTVNKVDGVNQDGTAKDEYVSSVSNCVNISPQVSFDETTGVYTYGTKQSFITAEHTKDFRIYIAGNNKDGKEPITANSTNTAEGGETLRVIMDYDSTLFEQMSRIMLEKDGTLNSKLSFIGDVIFGIEEYDVAETPTVTDIKLMQSTSTISQAKTTDNADNMSSTWKILLTYSDGTHETVTFDKSKGFEVTEIDTRSTGTKTATVTYNGLSTDITYTIVEGEPLTSITVSGDSTVVAGGSIQLSVRPNPNAVLNTANVRWSSSNTNVATVDNTGKVTTKGAGTAVITASTTVTVTNADGTTTETQLTDEFTITVTSTPIAVNGVSVTPTSATIDMATATELQLTATVSPTNATNKNVSWSSSNTNVATVDSHGKVTAKGAGTATITVTAQGDTSKTATCSIRVTGEAETVNVSGVSLNKTTLTLNKGENETLTATVSPDNATNKGVSWSSNKTSVATVDSNGKVTAVGAGTAIITVTTDDGNKTASCEVTVNEATTATYTVTFNMNGHGDNFTRTVNDGATVERPANPSATGYTFGGWYSDSTCETVFDFSSTITRDTIIYAKWTETPTDKTLYQILCEKNGVDGQTAVIMKDFSTTTEVSATKPSGAGIWYSYEDTATTPVCDADNNNVIVENGKAKLYDDGTSKGATIFITEFGNANGFVEGCADIQLIDGGSGWTFIRFCAGTAEKVGIRWETGLCVRYDGGKATAIDGAPSVTASSALQLHYKIENGKLYISLSSDLNQVSDTYQITYTIPDGVTINNLKFYSSNTGAKTMTVDNICVVTKGSAPVEPAQPTVTSVTVRAAGGATSVANDGTLQMLATVTGENNPEQTVTWSIKDGATATSASVSSSGVLSAGTVAGKVTVIATSTVDTSMSGELEITVEEVTTPVDPDPTTTSIEQSKTTWAAMNANETLIEGKNGEDTVFKVTTVTNYTVKNSCGVNDATGNILKFELHAGYSYSITVKANFQGDGRKLTLNSESTNRGDKSTKEEKALTHTWTVSNVTELKTLYLSTDDGDGGGVYLREVKVVATPTA